MICVTLISVRLVSFERAAAFLAWIRTWHSHRWKIGNSMNLSRPCRRLNARYAGTVRGLIKSITNLFIGGGIVAVACGGVHAQEDYSRINSHLGLIASVPLHPTANYVHTGWGLHGGVGYNLSRHHAAIGEFMWNKLNATDGAIRPLRALSSGVDGHSNLYVLTGNYRYESRGKVVGTYFIGGGGLYYRITNLSQRVTSGAATPCAPSWRWWGFNCSSGIVEPNQSVGSASSTALGGNAGLGFTLRVGEEPYRLYLESRYHYAPNRNVSTQLVTVSFGIRY